MNSQSDLAIYIAEMLLELRNMAKQHQYKTLQGLLEISYYEAYEIAHAVPPPEGAAKLLYDLGADARKHRAA